MTIIDRIAVGSITAVAKQETATDPYLEVDLHGLQLIEASAGTGKTYTLATLVTRLVVESGLRLGRILAVTFTEAATQELRARLRRRLALAVTIATELAGSPENESSADPESVLTRMIIRRQLQHEDAATLRGRLQRAESEIDLASVFTIHGFCARVLTEHALLSGQAFDAPTLAGSDRELMEEIAADLWRLHGADRVEAELLHVLWSSPDVLARDLGVLVRAPILMPPRPAPAPDPAPELQRALEALCAVFAEHGEQARADLDAAIAAKHIDGRKARQASYVKAWDSLAKGIAHSCLARSDDHLDKLTPTRLRECAKVGCEDKLPPSPLFDALGQWFDADQHRRQWLDAQAIDLLHRIRDEARVRLGDFKRQRRLRSYDDLIEGVADALDGPHGAELARSLRAQYAVALVDEFQDTDARQWSIFRRVFGGLATGTEHAGIDEPTSDETEDAMQASLFLIGDPKQAIYGFRGGDVHTYLAARGDATIAPPLAHNFRSRPSVLRAIEALYVQAGAEAFIDPAIAFRPVAPGPHSDDADYQRNGRAATALTVRALNSASEDRALPAGDARALATSACVAEIHAVLTDARAGRATIKGLAVQPGDIAVLVRSHAEAARMQCALAAVGVAAVAAGRQSLFATGEAIELLCVFTALLQPADDGRLRAALATVLLGVDGAGIERLDRDEDWHRSWQLQAMAWRERWLRHGPLALVTDLCAQHAQRLLGLVDGERRLTNLLQLGELLQEADARALGLHGLVDWLSGRIAEADPDDEQQLLRLESDAHRVQILTLHKSKGLEFPLVYLPFAGIGKRLDKPARHCHVPDANGRVLHWKAGREDESERWQLACASHEREQRAEDARLLYVGLTRARHALWLACGPFHQAGATALAPMLADLDALQAHQDISVDSTDVPAALEMLPSLDAGTVPPARRSRRTLSRDWWVYSFTQLTHASGGAETLEDAGRASAPERPSADEAGAPARVETDDAGEDAPIDYRFSGSRFGNVLHAALEHVDFDAWCDWRAGDAPPPGQEQALRAALSEEGYAADQLDDGTAELAALVGQTLTVQLPEGARLCELPPVARRAEMEFHFALQPTSIDALLATLHAHGVLNGRRSFGARRQLEGLMTGKIDLVYLHEGRYYVLDYKSNRLPDYRPATIERAMDDSEYSLQALIYTVALHRWLRFRLGDDYDYARDFGGVRYLFCRGLDADAQDSPGLHAQQPEFALVDALDALFAGRGQAA
ncbi:MAG: exodeoxyribonuclease V subunit beta [Pseudomonadota bacterium]|nr:exodeoxyribonuclease V subunit beta [Pseudomonadota bacterium]